MGGWGGFGPYAPMSERAGREPANVTTEGRSSAPDDRKVAKMTTRHEPLGEALDALTRFERACDDQNTTVYKLDRLERKCLKFARQAGRFELFAALLTSAAEGRKVPRVVSTIDPAWRRFESDLRSITHQREACGTTLPVPCGGEDEPFECAWTAADRELIESAWSELQASPPSVRKWSDRVTRRPGRGRKSQQATTERHVDRMHRTDQGKFEVVSWDAIVEDLIRSEDDTIDPSRLTADEQAERSEFLASLTGEAAAMAVSSDSWDRGDR